MYQSVRHFGRFRESQRRFLADNLALLELLVTRSNVSLEEIRATLLRVHLLLS